MSIEENIEKILLNHQVKGRHSYFQLQNFLIGKEPTIQSKLWKCVTELKSRKETLNSIKLELEDLNDSMELINIQIEKIEVKSDSEIDKLSKQENIINIRRLNRKNIELTQTKANLQERQDNLLEECDFLIRAFDSLIKLEPIKPYDDVGSQRDFWNKKLGQDLNLRLLLGMPHDMETIKTILALNKESETRQDLLNLVDAIQLKLENKKEVKKHDI